MRFALASLILLAASSAYAADKGVQSDSAQRLAQLTIRFQNEDGTPQACLPERTTFGAELKREYLERPADFGGISPQSAYWPEVEELNYQQRLTGCQSSKRLADKWAEMLVRDVAPADIDAALAFHTSPAGRRYAASLAKASKEFIAFSRLPSAQQEAANVTYRKALRDLTARYLADPK
jgi:hypothetical protein